MENPGDGGLRSSLLTGRLTERNERGEMVLPREN
jgi:hypothetical protein